MEEPWSSRGGRGEGLKRRKQQLATAQLLGRRQVASRHRHRRVRARRHHRPHAAAFFLQYVSTWRSRTRCGGGNPLRLLLKAARQPPRPADASPNLFWQAPAWTGLDMLGHANVAALLGWSLARKNPLKSTCHPRAHPAGPRAPRDLGPDPKDCAWQNDVVACTALACAGSWL